MSFVKRGKSKSKLVMADAYEVEDSEDTSSDDLRSSEDTHNWSIFPPEESTEGTESCSVDESATIPIESEPTRTVCFEHEFSSRVQNGHFIISAKYLWISKQEMTGRTLVPTQSFDLIPYLRSLKFKICPHINTDTTSLTKEKRIQTLSDLWHQIISSSDRKHYQYTSRCRFCFTEFKMQAWFDSSTSKVSHFRIDALHDLGSGQADHKRWATMKGDENWQAVEYPEHSISRAWEGTDNFLADISL